MNHKKILHLTRKFNLFAKVRRANPYKHIAQATQAHRTIPNHLDRGFNQNEAGKVLLTDIIYLDYEGEQRAYLS